MGLFRKVVSIRPNQIGYLYQRNKLRQRLLPGIYKFFDFQREIDFIAIPTISKIITIVNQEVLTKDNISLRISYLVEYQITDSDVFVGKFNLFEEHNYPHTAIFITEAENLIHNLSQVYLRSEIAQVESQQINNQRQEILNYVPDALQNKLSEYGIFIHKLIVKDINFPKMIQQLFAQQLETKIRAKLDLENARTTVATSRALKNASELMNSHENIKFIQFLETMSKIAAQGKHTFIVGDLQHRPLK
ncbi:MAG: slipin family protein [Cyanobacteria bacterium P01_E01_bin.35]